MEPCGLHNHPFFDLRNVTEPHELCNDASFLISGVSRNLTDCASILSFDFWHVTELHKLPNDGCQAPQNDQIQVACHQAKVPGRN